MNKFKLIFLNIYINSLNNLFSLNKVKLKNISISFITN